MGVPDPERIWDDEDFSRALLTLSEIKWEKPFELPVKDSKKSGLLFNRMISHDNMKFMQDDKLRLAEKGYELLIYLRVYENLSDLYTDPRFTKQYYHRELIAINIHLSE